MLFATLGAPLTLATVITKSSLIAALLPSVAVTRTVIAPISPLAGVPENVRVAALKVSHVGNGSPLASVAE